MQQVHSFVFEDKYSSHLDKYEGKLPAFGAFTVALRRTGTEEVLSPWGTSAWIQRWEAGFSFCSPLDIPRYSAEVGNTIAMERALDNPIFIDSTVAMREDPFPACDMFTEFHNLEFAYEFTHVRFPRWFRHALDLQTYLSVVPLRDPQGVVCRRRLCPSPLARKIFTGTEQRLVKEIKNLRKSMRFLGNVLVERADIT